MIRWLVLLAVLVGGCCQQEKPSHLEYQGYCVNGQLGCKLEDIRWKPMRVPD